MSLFLSGVVIIFILQSNVYIGLNLLLKNQTTRNIFIQFSFIMATVLITGGTGIIGKRLSSLLIEKGYKVIILTRNHNLKHKTIPSNASFASWNPEKGEIDIQSVQQAEYIINLAGANIAEKRWTMKRKAIIAY